MPQYALPVSDVSKVSWQQVAGDFDANAWNELDEGFGAGRGSGSGPDDATTMWQTSSLSSSGAVIECVLSSVTDPSVHTGHTIRARIAKNATGGANVTYNLYLRQGASTLIATSSLVYDSTAYYTIEYTLTEAEAANITDYTDLRLRLTVFMDGGNGRRARVSAFELEVPDLAPTSTNGQLSKTLSALTVSSTGKVYVVGAESNTLATLTLTGTGKVSVSSSLEKTLDGLTVEADGDVTVKGSTNSTLSSLGISSSGLVDIAGSLSATLMQLTISATGSVTNNASANNTLGDIEINAVGEVRYPFISGGLSQTLSALTSQSTGQVLITGVAGGSLSATVSSEGILSPLPIDGAVDNLLGLLQSSSTAKVDIVGSADITLQDATVFITNETLEPIEAYFIQQLQPLIANIRGVISHPVITGSVSKTLNPTTIESNGFVLPLVSNGFLFQTLGGLTLNSSGYVPVNAVVGKTLSNTRLVANAVVPSRDIELVIMQVCLQLLLNKSATLRKYTDDAVQLQSVLSKDVLLPEKCDIDVKVQREINKNVIIRV